jgi:hypothetical protein
MIDRREIAIDVAAKHVAIAVAVTLVPPDRLVRPFPQAIGVGIEDEATLEDRLDHGAEGVMDNAVAEWRGRDKPVLRLENLDLDIAAGTPVLSQQFPFEPQHLGFQSGHEGGGTRFAALAADGAASGPHQRAKLGDSSEQVRMARGHDLP